VKQRGRARRDLLISLVPPGRRVIDVGADHGHVAAALGAIATERMPHRRGRKDVRWVVADGLTPFREVDVAIIAGMGARTIEGILERGPRPRVAILHAPDDPQRLRTWLGSHGWRIDREGLAPEGNRFAEVVRAVPGEESATGLELAYGPRLLTTGDPWLVPHLEHHRAFQESLAEQVGPRAPRVREAARERAAFLARALARWRDG
jgi:tRNA A22 N-methylase